MKITIDHHFEALIEERGFFVRKLEEIGLLDPTVATAKSTGPAGKGTKGSPSKKKGEVKPSMSKFEFSKFIYPDILMKNTLKPPTIIYLPTGEVMRKMIKACIKIESLAEIHDKF